ncbi:hypothetical protein P692DRAFT_2083947 [Suillus brevipes Sb2]|nr:hypothetical protein P692DRAFT_2083947 [Suillus brevipes Sb2]
MRFSFFTIIVALATSIMSVSACACAPREAPCTQDRDCCDPLDKCVLIVSRSSLLCQKNLLDDSPFGSRHISRMVPNFAIIKAISQRGR